MTMVHAHGALHSLIISYLESRYPGNRLGKAGKFQAFDSAGFEPEPAPKMLD